MPSYRVDLPDGTSYRVDSPTDLEESQVISHVQGQIGQGTTGAKPDQSETPAPAQAEAGGETPPSFIQSYLQDVKTAVAPGAMKAVPGYLAENVQEMAANAHRIATTPLKDLTHSDVSSMIGTVAGSMAPEAKFLGPGMIETIAAKEMPQVAKTVKAVTKPAVEESISSVLNRDVSERDLGRGIIREEAGQTIQQRAQQVYNLNSEIKQWSGKTTNENIAAMKAAQTGDLSTIPVENRALVKTLQDIFESKKQKVIDIGNAESPPKDYFESLQKYYWPQQWTDPEQAANVLDKLMSQRTAAEGSKAFLHTKTIDDIQQGLDLGLKLKHPNVIESSLVKNAEIDRFIMAHNIKNSLVDEGVVLKNTEPAPTIPSGWVRLKDPNTQGLTQYYAPPEVARTSNRYFIPGKTVDIIDASKRSVGIPPDWVKLDDRLFNGAVYYAHPQVAKDFNNYFSPGLKGNPYYDALLGTNHLMTQAQLGFSGFHWFTDAHNTYLSDLSLAFEQASRGNLSDATINGLSAASYIGSPIRALVAGDRMIQEYLSPGSYSQYAEEAKALATVGANLHLDPMLLNKSIGGFKQAVVDGNWTKAAAKSLPAVLELQARPLMSSYVPRLKAGTFQLLTRDILDRSQAQGWSSNMTRLELQKAWDSVGNRLGQLQLENLFWPKVATDIAQAGIRAPGWMIGDFAEYGGGVLDLKTQAGRALVDHKFDVTHRMAFSMATAVGTAYINGIITWLATGELPSGKDYIWPRDGTKDANGNSNRLNPLGYARDIIAYVGRPAKAAMSGGIPGAIQAEFKTLSARVAPWITGAVELIQNRDFHNVEVIHPSDPIASQGAQLVKFLAELSGPLSIKTYQQRAQGLGGGTVGLALQSISGLLPAPAEFIKTPAQNMVAELGARHYAAGPKTREEATKLNDRLSLENGFRRGAIGVGDLIKAVGKGTINNTQLNNIIRNKGLPTIVNGIKALDPDEAYEVYKIANGNERQFIYSEVSRKLVNAMKQNPEDSSLRDRLIEFSSIPVVPPQAK